MKRFLFFMLFLGLIPEIGFSQTIDTSLLLKLKKELSVVGGKVVLDYNFWYCFEGIDSSNQIKVNTIAYFLNKNPKTRIELSCHTDCRGSFDYSMSISSRQAEQIKSDIITQRIDNEKIVAKGYGKKRLIRNCDCITCTDDEHRINRRVEVLTIISGNEEDVVEGKLIWNLFTFDGFYGLPDSIVNLYKDTFLKKIKGREYEKEIKELIEDYNFLESSKLLYTPCRFVVVNESLKLRVFLSEEDNKLIQKSNWFNKNKKEKLQTYLRMKLRWIKDKTYYCEDLIEIDQRKIVESKY